MEVRLPRGHFCGSLLKRDEVGGFVLTEYSYPAELKISKHLHEQAYFCIVLQGNYTENYGKRIRTCDRRAKLIVRVDRGQLEIGADGQDAADALAEADTKEIERRVKLAAMTKTFLEGMVVWNPEVVKDALGPNGDLEYWRVGWTDESRQLGQGKGKLRSIEVLGVVPGGYPRGIQNAIARFNYEKGSSPYKITWLYRERFSKDIIGGTYLRSADLSAVTPLQAESRESFAGWNIIAEKGFRVTFEITRGDVTRLKVHGKNNVWPARKLLSN